MAPLLIAMVLESLTEMSLRQSLIMSDNSLSIFVTRPICLIFLILSLGSIMLPFFKNRKNKAKAA